MSRIFIEESTLAAIGDSIRSKTGKTELISPLDMPAEIGSITTGGAASLIPLTVTENGIYYPKESLEVGKSYTFKNDYTQDELRAFYDLSTTKQTSSNGITMAILLLSGNAMAAILCFEGFYGVATNDGIWIPEEAAVMLGYTKGWNAGSNLSSLAPTATPVITIEEGYELSFEGNLADLEFLFDIPSADGFSRVEVNVAGGSTSIDGVEAYMVTYVGADDSILHTKPVVAGDDTYNPYALGKIDKPIKESTIQYNFEYNGWTLAQGGSANNAALECVQEDRVIYAAFAETVRTYTVRFWDGDTLMSETQVEYGAQATPPDHVKEGTIFMGWTPSDLTITQDTDFYGEWMEGMSFESATWEQIKTISESGQASNVFSIGDERTITLTWEDGSTEDCVIRIAAFDADTIYDDVNATRNKAGITIDTKNVISKTSASGITSSATYKASTLKKTLENTVYPALPSDLQAVIKDTVIPSFTYYNYSKISPLCHTNLGIYQDGLNLQFPTTFATHYPIYTQSTSLATNSNNTSRIKYNAAGEAVLYWTCDRNSKISNSSQNYTSAITTTGGTRTEYNTNENYVAFRFAI